MAVDTACAVVHALPVEAVLREPTPEDEITVFVVRGVVRVFTVLRLHDVDVRFWHVTVEGGELCKEWFLEIDVLPILHGVPSITPPDIALVDRVGRMWRVIGENILPCLIALTAVQIGFIPERQA